MAEQDEKKANFMATVMPLVSAAYDQGFSDGFQAGEVLGYVQGVNALTPAISDGLRHGSPECGRAMQGLKNMGAIATDGEEIDDEMLEEEPDEEPDEEE